MAFINIIQDKFDDWTKNVISVEQKWVQIFNICKEKDVNVSNLTMVVEFAFCLPGSNASTERVFSLMTTTWTDVRNQMDNKTIECCLITKIYGLSCIEFYNEIIKNPTFLNKIHITDKYKISLDDKNKEK
jgi:hypothetical protein